MKTIIVKYQDLFNNEKVVVAKNKLKKPSEHISLKKLNSFTTVEEKEIFLRKHAMVCACECNHPVFIDGVCMYRNCRHSIKEHN